MNKKGFTLIELLIVVIIIAGLAAATYPTYRTFIERSRVNEAINLVSTIQAAEQKHFVSYESYGAQFRDINDFEPNIERNQFNPNSNTFNTKYFKYTLHVNPNQDSKAYVTAERRNSDNDIITNEIGYKILAIFHEDFIRCLVYNEEGEKICSSLTDQEKQQGSDGVENNADFYPIR